MTSPPSCSATRPSSGMSATSERYASVPRRTPVEDIEDLYLTSTHAPPSRRKRWPATERDSAGAFERSESDVSAWSLRPRLDAGGDSRRASRSSRGVEASAPRSEEHTSELQSRQYLVCRLLLEKKNDGKKRRTS